MYYIGLDVGTSSLKTTLIDEDKKIVYETSHPYAFDEPFEGYREIDPDIWFQSVLQSLSSIFAQYDEKDIACIGVTGQMHTTVFLDDEGSAVRKAIMWNDLRSAYMVETLREELSKLEETRHIANILSPGNPAINTLWVKEHEPNVFTKIRKIMSAYDYIVFRLTGAYSADYCDASTSSLYDIASKKWSKYMFDKLGISEDYVGPIHASCDVVGTLLESLCEQLHTHAIAVIAGTGDNPANAVALGLLHKRDPVISLGTSGVVIMPKADNDFEGKGKNVLFNACHEKFVNVVQGTVRSAGGTHKWWIENIIESKDMSVDQTRIDKCQLGKHNVLFFPHITGDKLIYKDIETRGAYVGLSANTKREDMLQALFEGVSYAIREVLENMNLSSWPKLIQINGGGTKSAIWMHIMANVLHTRLEVVTTQASPGYGVSLLARMVDKQGEDEEITSMCGDIYVPEEDIIQAYHMQYEKYKRMYQALKQITQ